MTYNWFMGPGTYAGDPYAPDEVAKTIVAELKLRDGDTVSKDQIVQYLDKSGMGPLWATDVAMVLRNMFGVTPIFYESKAETIIEDVGSVLGNETAEPELTNEDISAIYALALEETFNDSSDETEDAIVAALSAESMETVALISCLNSWLSEDQLIQFESVYAAGGDSLVESWYDAVSRPHMIRFMEPAVIEAISEAIGVAPDELEEGFRSDVKAQRRQSADLERQVRARMAARAQGHSPDDAPAKFDRAVQRNKDMANRPDPLAARAADSKNLLFRHQMDKSAGGFDRVLSGKAQNSKEGERQFVNKQMNTAKAGMDRAKENPVPLPSHEPPKPGIAKSALTALGHVMKGAGHLIHLGVRGASDKLDKFAQKPMNKSAPQPDKRSPDASPMQAREPEPEPAAHDIGRPEPAQKPSLASRVVGVAGRVAKGALGGVIGGLHGMATGKGVGGRLGGLVKGTIGGAAVGQAHGQEGGGSMRHMLRAKARIKAPGLMYALHGAPNKEELQAASHLGLHQHYANMGYDLNKVHDPKYGMQEPVAQPKPKREPKPKQDSRRMGVRPPLQQGAS